MQHPSFIGLIGKVRDYLLRPTFDSMQELARRPDAATQIDLNALVPKEFGEWREVRSAFVQVDLTPRRDGEEAERTTDSPYDQTVIRTYVRRAGATVMLALAYGSKQRQDVKIHRPELCYVAQGFQVGRKEHAPLALSDGRSVTESS